MLPLQQQGWLQELKDKCHFVHVCSLCFARRPSYQCKVEGAKDTQGAGA